MISLFSFYNLRFPLWVEFFEYSQQIGIRASIQDRFCICFMVDQVIRDQPFCLLLICVVSLRFYQEYGQHN